MNLTNQSKASPVGGTGSTQGIPSPSSLDFLGQSEQNRNTSFDWKDPEQMLEFDIKFAIQQYRYNPPARFDKDPNAADRYYSSIAKAVLNQLKLSWTFTRKSDREIAG